MSRVVALIDGEHYPPVVRAAIESLARQHEVLAAAFIGGTEKVDGSVDEAYGVPIVRAASARDALEEAYARFQPEVFVDLSDEPVVSPADRFRLAALALHLGAAYVGADFSFMPPRATFACVTPTLAIIGTGKRVGKTAISAYVARHLKERRRDIVVLAMGRGGPAEPEVIHGDEVALATADLLALAAQGKHAASDNYEDAVMSRVTTVGCRRCGGGLAGQTFFGNVEEGARIADALGKELIILEGSGAAIPPVVADATMLVVGARQGLPYVRDHFGPYRLARSDAVVIAGAEEPIASAASVEAVRAFIARERPGVPVVAVTFRPKPIEPIEGLRVFYASTAPADLLPTLGRHLEDRWGCTVVASSPHLSNRARLREDLHGVAARVDVFVTELKAAAIDVVASVGETFGIPTVLCDNEPIPVAGDDLEAMIDHLVGLACRRTAEEGRTP